jgi:hypothetical protein
VLLSGRLTSRACPYKLKSLLKDLVGDNDLRFIQIYLLAILLLHFYGETRLTVRGEGGCKEMVAFTSPVKGWQGD